MKPRRVTLTLELTTDLPLDRLAATKTVWLATDMLEERPATAIYVEQAQANVVRASRRKVK